MSNILYCFNVKYHLYYHYKSIFIKSQTEEYIIKNYKIDNHKSGLLPAADNYRKKGLCASDEAKAAVGDQFIVDYIRVFDEV